MTAPTPPTAVVVGAGPAGLMAAETLAAAGLAVTVHDRMPAPGRKLLMAGRGGLNLTHSEPFETFMARYGEAASWLRPAIATFPPADLRAWAEGLGQPCFVGSSGRVFPAAMKASPLLRAWLARLGRLGVRFNLRHRWTGWDVAGALRFETPGGVVTAAPAVTVLALGGASWPRLGSDGGWVGSLRDRGIAVTPLAPSNAGVACRWSDGFAARHAGAPLKRIAVAVAGRRVRGEAVVTRSGLEGGAVYAVSAALRDGLAQSAPVVLSVDLCPDRDRATLARRLAAVDRRQSLANRLRKAAGLAPTAVALWRECADPATAASPEVLAASLKAVPVPVYALAPIERAISTAGGIAAEALDENFMLKHLPGVFACGEMLDWDAPTGGYLLQACFATGRAAGQGASSWLAFSVAGAAPAGQSRS